MSAAGSSLDPATADIPVILITALSDRDAKMSGLEAGGRRLPQTKPVDEVTLLAACPPPALACSGRATPRASCASGGEPVLGFARTRQGSRRATRPVRIALVAAGPEGCCAVEDRAGRSHRGRGVDPAAGPPPHRGRHARDRGRPMSSSSPPISRTATKGCACCRTCARARWTRERGDGDDPAAGRQRTRRHRRSTSGAHDILYDPIDPQELALRIRTQLARKLQDDRLRASLQAGLELAVRDSLTGLHNRRYAVYETGPDESRGRAAGWR